MAQVLPPEENFEFPPQAPRANAQPDSPHRELLEAVQHEWPSQKKHYIRDERDGTGCLVIELAKASVEIPFSNEELKAGLKLMPALRVLVADALRPVRDPSAVATPPMERATLDHAEESLQATAEAVTEVCSSAAPEDVTDEGLVHRVLHCPSCKKPHVDEKEFAIRNHRIHRCVDGVDGPGCGVEWESPTPCVGVRPPPELIPVDIEALAHWHVSDAFRYFYRRLYPSAYIHVVQPVQASYDEKMRSVINGDLTLDRPALEAYLRDCGRWGFIPERPHFATMLGAGTAFDPSRMAANLREQAYAQRVKQAVFFSKLVEVAPDQDLPLEYVEKTARVLQHLYDNDMIVAGMLCQVCRVNLGRPCKVTEGGRILYDAEWKPLAAIFFGTFSPLPDSKEETAHGRLNAFLRNEAFHPDGQVGNGDWTNL